MKTAENLQRRKFSTAVLSTWSCAVRDWGEGVPVTSLRGIEAWKFVTVSVLPVHEERTKSYRKLQISTSLVNFPCSYTECNPF